ncbi:MAG TPA: efflux RND transporter permease subunit [Pseudomonadota bacterium]|nr:efflux RND transporter permease subunit [Xanthomonadales bacterium]HQX23933.1 efflux RND transporter permease subunit [Pseudomonadota bacterium]HQY35536.1 efflux RND transporter permease subunit [Pseudomonadota bacterium]
MLISDLSVKRPVFATVLSLMLVVLGVIAFTRLPLRELPNIDSPIVSIETAYRGASAAIVESRITQPIEDTIAGIEGIETINSSSQNGRSQISIEFGVDRDIEGAANDVRDAVSRVIGNLPVEADPPQVAKVDADAEVIMWLSLSATDRDLLALNDYAERYVVDRLSSLDGVARVMVGGGQRYAMRIWLDRAQLNARGLTVNDVVAALRRENVELPAGRVESTTRDFSVRLMRSYADAADFAELTVAKGADGHLVKLGEVAEVKLDSIERRADFRGNGLPQLGLGIIKTSTANTLSVASAVKAEVERIQGALPAAMALRISFDSSVFVESSVNEVYKTMIEAIVLVVAVIYLFLGSWRAALIPAVTVPVCVIGTFIALYAFGYSLNLLTLLALVLSVGLVVDDAIVVLENCQRRVDLGEPRLVAAYRGSRQVAFAVIATTAVLVSVFLPIGFLEGNLGRLFRELAIALATAVAISAFVALTLSPMMCSKLLTPHVAETGLTVKVDALFQRVSARYRSLLESTIGHPWIFGGVMLGALALSGLLAWQVPKELAPPEDRGAFFIMANGPEGAGFDYTLVQMRAIESRLLAFVERGDVDRVNVRTPRGMGGVSSEEMNTGQAIVIMKPWEERDSDTATVMEEVRQSLEQVSSMRAFPQMRQGMSRGFGQPVQFVIGGPSYQQLAEWRDRMLARIAENPSLVTVDTDYKETRPQLRIEIDRARAADLGVAVDEIGTTLETMMGGRRVTTFDLDGEEYDVVVQGRIADRRQPADLTNLYVRSARSGEMIPLANLVTVEEQAVPGTLNRFNRLRSITISAGMVPGYTQGEALAFLDQVAREELPAVANVDYKGDSREFRRSSGGVYFTFAMALLVVFLVLAAQFESFVHPFVIMLTVPLAVLGALLGIALTGGSLNLFSQVGIVMLVGLAAKNGILIVEFANQLRDMGRSVRDAVIESASIRLRPIVMTSIATVVGALPLVLATGAGASSRTAIGVVVVFGVLLSTVLSLFVVPVFYLLLARHTGSPDAVSRELDRLDHEHPASEAVA